MGWFGSVRFGSGLLTGYARHHFNLIFASYYLRASSSAAVGADGDAGVVG